MTALQHKTTQPSRLRRARLDGQLTLPFVSSTARPVLRARARAIEPRPALPKVVVPRTGAASANPRPAEEVRLEKSLSRQLPKGRAISLRLTDNRYTMVMVRRGPAQYVVRLHRMFAGAAPALVRAIGRYVVANEAAASAVIGAFIEKNRQLIAKQPQRERRVILRTSGRTYDLQAIYDRLNQEYFAGALAARITWGSAPRRQLARRSIKMGSFAVEDRLIRIHPVLDDGNVPEYFVAWIVFHEMLHGKFEVVRKGDRRCFHSKEFLAEERTFRDYQRASAWERANMDRLLGPVG